MFHEILQMFNNEKLALPLAMNLIRVVREDLLLARASSPTLAIIGEPGSGKTPLVKACLKDVKFVKAQDRRKTIVKASEEKADIVIVDDFANFNSYSDQQLSKKNFDWVIRTCFEGSGALAVLTLESEVIRLLAESGKQRLVPIQMGAGLHDEELSHQISYLQESDILETLIEKFKVYCNMHKESITSISNSLKRFRDEYRDKTGDLKRIDMVFCFHYVMSRLNSMLLEEGEMGIDIRWLEDFYILKSNLYSSEGKNLTETVFQQVIKSGLLKPQIPMANDVCMRYAERGCNECFYGCLDNCANNYGGDLGTYYEPHKLILEYNKGTNALLIENSKRVYQTYKWPASFSLLVVDADIFMNMMNSALCSLRDEGYKSRIEFYTGQKLHQELFRINRILAIKETRTWRYTMSYPARGVGDIDTSKVVVVLLKPEEVQVIKEQMREDYRMENLLLTCYMEESPYIVRTIKHLFDSVSISLGDIGVEQEFMD